MTLVVVGARPIDDLDELEPIGVGRRAASAKAAARRARSRAGSQPLSAAWASARSRLARSISARKASRVAAEAAPLRDRAADGEIRSSAEDAQDDGEPVDKTEVLAGWARAPS